MKCVLLLFINLERQLTLVSVSMRQLAALFVNAGSTEARSLWGSTYTFHQREWSQFCRF